MTSKQELTALFAKYSQEGTNWTGAEEVREIAMKARTTYNELELDICEDEVEAHAEAVQPRDFRQAKTRKAWNALAQEQFEEALERMSEKTAAEVKAYLYFA